MSRLLGIALVAALLAGAGYGWWRTRHDGTPPSGLSLYGSIDIREIRLAFREPEQLDSVRVEEGQHVAAGQLLATQSTRLLDAQVAAAEAAVRADRAALARLEAGSRPEEIRKAQADVEAAAAGLREAAATARRVEQLAASGAIDRQRADDTAAAAANARAQLKAVQAALDLAVAGPREEDITQAQALLAGAEAQLRLAQERLRNTRLLAPQDGIVRERLLEPGDIAAPDRPVLVLALTDPVWVRAYAPEPLLGRLREGMPAEVASDSFPDRRYAGWLGYVSPTAEFTPKSVQTEALRTSLVYQLRVFVCNPRGELRLGMPVTVHIPEPGEQAPGAAVPPCTGGAAR